MGIHVKDRQNYLIVIFSVNHLETPQVSFTNNKKKANNNIKAGSSISKIGSHGSRQHRLTDFPRTITPKGALNAVHRTTTSDLRLRKGLTNKVAPASSSMSAAYFSPLRDTAFSKVH